MRYNLLALAIATQVANIQISYLRVVLGLDNAAIQKLEFENQLGVLMRPVRLFPSQQSFFDELETQRTSANA